MRPNVTKRQEKAAIERILREKVAERAMARMINPAKVPELDLTIQALDKYCHDEELDLCELMMAICAVATDLSERIQEMDD